MVLAATDYVQFLHAIEGYRIADLKWGTPNAVPVVLRAEITLSMIGQSSTVAFSIRNGALTQSYVTTVQWLIQTTPPIYANGVLNFAIPGCTSGVWANDNTPGMYISMCMYAGTSRTAPAANVWTAGDFIGVGTLGPMLGNSDVTLTNVGLYADPNNTGKSPPFERPSDRQLMFDCQRHWQKQMGAIGVGIASTTTHQRASYPTQEFMRITPAAALVGVGRAWDQATIPNITGVANNYCTDRGLEFNFISASAQNTGRAAVYLDGSPTIYIAQNARMI